MILITHIALRIGVIAFIFAFYFDLIDETDPNTPFWENIFSVGALVVIVASSVLLLVLDKPKFEVFGFFLVFVISMFRILAILFESGSYRENINQFSIDCFIFLSVDKALHYQTPYGRLIMICLHSHSK